MHNSIMSHETREDNCLVAEDFAGALFGLQGSLVQENQPLRLVLKTFLFDMEFILILSMEITFD